MEPTNRKVALVTGGRRGIGLAIARSLCKKGFDIALNDVVDDRDTQLAIDELMDLGARAEFIRADISKLDEVIQLSRAAWSAFGRVDCLVNNAGIPAPIRGDILDVDVADFDRVIAVNLRGTFLLTQHITKMMAATPNADKPRSVITISSVSADHASIERAAYCISKSALSMMTKLFAVRLAEFGINTFEVRPGIIRTDMTAAVSEKYDRLIEAGISPMRRWGLPEDVGATVAMLACGFLPFTTGQTIDVDGGLSIPRL